MATNITTYRKAFVGNGAPADGDALSNPTFYPVDSVYTDRTTGLSYVRSGVTKAASDWNTSDGSTPTVQTVYSLKTTLTDAQIKALPSTPVELVPAPGSGKMIVATSFFALSNTLAGGYTNLDDAPDCIINIGLGISGNSTLYDSLNYIRANPKMGDAAKSLFIGGLITAPNANWGTESNSYAMASGDLSNKPLVIGCYNNSGDFTGGDSANTLEVTVFYSIVDL